MKKYFNFILVFALVIFAPLVFTACEKSNKNYSISISQAAHGTIETSKSEANSGETIYVTVTPNTGYALEENSLKYNATVIEDLQFTMPEENVVISANFVLRTYSVNYNVNEWTENPNPTSFNMNTPSITLAPPTRIGFDFVGWYLDEEFEEEITEIEQGTTHDLNIYPKFNQIFVVDEQYQTINDITSYGDTLETLYVPSVIDGVTIKSFAVQRACNNVQTLTLEDGIKTILAYLTLWDSQNLTTVNLPKSIDIENYTAPLFKNCERLRTINLDSQNENIYLENGVLYKDVVRTSYETGEQHFTYLCCYPICLGQSTFTIPEKVTHLTHFGKARFTKVVIPSTVIKFCPCENNIDPFSECRFMTFMEVSPSNEHFYVYNDMLIEDTLKSVKTYATGVTTSPATLIHVLNVGRLSLDLTQEIVKDDTQKYYISDVVDDAFDACVDMQYIVTDDTHFNIRVFDNKPNLKAYITQERPDTPTWSDQQYYEYIFKCQNIYWYSETNKSSQYKCWHYIGDDITIW